MDIPDSDIDQARELLGLPVDASRDEVIETLGHLKDLVMEGEDAVLLPSRRRSRDALRASMAAHPSKHEDDR